MKWKFPRWINTFWYCSTRFCRNLKAFNAAATSTIMLTYDMFTVAAKDCKYSTYFWIVEDSVTSNTNGGRYISVVFTVCWLGYRFSRTWVNQSLNIATAWSCEFHLWKQSQKKNKELKWFKEKALSNLGGSWDLLMIGFGSPLAHIQLFDVWCGELDNHHLC